MKKRIVLCADDYGQALEVSKGIIDLVQTGRLSAVSCLTSMPLWATHSQWLKPYQDKIDIGLHLNLTEGEGSTPLRKLMLQAIFRRLNPAAIEASFHQQIDAFIKMMGFYPHFIDGHQHVHQFPVIRDVLLRIYEQRLRGVGTYLRLVNPRIQAKDLLCDIKKVVITLMGARAFKRLLLKRQIPHNSSFAGIYAFDQASRYSALFPGFLREIADKGMIMCHPGLAAATDDAIAAARVEEYKYFNSDKYLRDYEAQGVVLSRLI